MPSSAYTATTAIYTLSLHDALPICRFGSGLWWSRDEFLDSMGEPPRVSIRRRMVRGIADVACAGYQRWYVLAHSQGTVVAFNGLMADRKSTRLNSSHVEISYAVFCLYGDHRDLHSFPTRRSSDLPLRFRAVVVAG